MVDEEGDSPRGTVILSLMGTLSVSALVSMSC